MKKPKESSNPKAVLSEKRPLAKLGEELMRLRRLMMGRIDGSQDDVAKRVNFQLRDWRLDKTISPGLIAKYEAGRIADPDPDVIRALALVFGVDPVLLLLQLFKEKYEPPSDGWSLLDADRLQLAELILEESAVLSGEGAEFLRDRRRLPQDLLTFDRQLLVDSRRSQFESAPALDVAGMAAWQKNFPGLTRFWVVAPNFLDDQDDRIQQAVVDNLQRGVVYEYFIDENSTVLARFRALQKKLASLLGKKDIKSQVRGYLLPPTQDPLNAWLGTYYIVANPLDYAAGVAFQCVRQNSRTVWAVRMLDEDRRAFVAGWQTCLGNEIK